MTICDQLQTDESQLHFEQNFEFKFREKFKTMKKYIFSSSKANVHDFTNARGSLRHKLN